MRTRALPLLAVLIVSGCSVGALTPVVGTSPGPPRDSSTSAPYGEDTTSTSAPYVEGTTSTSSPAPASEDALADLLAAARVEPERRDGYDRDLFPHWEDSDNDRCNTREEVLIRDSRSLAQVDAYGCKVLAGDWYSSYDNRLWSDPSEVDIDHVVALSEAWASGAWGWDVSRRTAFANDLSDTRTLRAVTSSVNRSKSDRDLSEWLPPDAGAVCSYVSDWIAVKVRWELSFDAREFAVARELVSGSCRGTDTLPVLPVSGSQPTTDSPSADGVLYRNCAAARAAGAAPLTRDDPGYRPALDGDGDGVACE